MKAIVMKKYGENEIQLMDIPRPQIQNDEVLVEVYSAAINPIDIKIPKGQMKPLLNYKLPLVLGTDISGKVVEVGANITRFKIGDEVYASFSTSKLGAFAEYSAVKENELSLKPKNLSFDEAASLPLVGLTVYQALHDVAKLTKGQKVFIKAGSGGIGTFAIQFAKALGAEVATTTSAKNSQFVQQLGADHVIDYHTQKFENILNNYDVVLDSVDGEPVTRGVSILKPGGHLLSVVGPPDAKFAKAAGLNFIFQWLFGLLSWNINRLSRKIGAQYTFVFVKPNGLQLEKIKDLVENNKIKPVVDRVFPMDEVREAFSYVSIGRTRGKVVLKIRDS
jgi:alcohol dehydrogenase